MKFVIIMGSHRQKSQSSKVGAYIEKSLQKEAHEVETIDLAGNPLPLWDEGVWAKDEKWQKLWQPLAKKLTDAEAAIVISPEWSGMVPAGLKNFFLLLGKELAHKPALIVAVSSGRGGSYPVAELRTSSYKNTSITYIPEHVIVRDVENVLNGAEPQSDDDTYIRGRLAYATKVLTEYGKALRSVRESGVADFKTYPFGM